jgi:ABC-type microcin C transport system permease subunit YejB
MTAYVIRRILYAIPIVIGVNLITFAFTSTTMVGLRSRFAR